MLKVYKKKRDKLLQRYNTLLDYKNLFPIEGITQSQKSITIEDVKTKGEQIIRLKGGSEFGPAAAILNVVRCIVNNEKRLLTLSAYVDGEFDEIRDVCIGVPVKIGKDGVEEVVSIELDKSELEAFKKSAEIIKKYCEEVKNI